MALSTALEAYYTLDGHSTDYTLHGHNGIDTAGVNYSPCIINDGADTTTIFGIITFGLPIPVGGVFSINLWIKPKANPLNQALRSSYGAVIASDSNNGLFFHQPTPPALGLELWVNSLQVTVACTEGVGFWLTMTSDGTTMRIYKNAVEVANAVVTPAWTFRTLLASGGNSCAAYIDEVGIWSRVLTGPEITELYNGGAGVSYSYIAVPPAPPAVPPVISNMTPASGTPIYPNTPIQFDVTDDSGVFTAIIVMVSFSDGSYEVIHDSAQFAPRYRSSTNNPITNGFTFNVRRNGGWPSAPTIKVVGVDAAGGENPQ